MLVFNCVDYNCEPAVLSDLGVHFACSGSNASKRIFFSLAYASAKEPAGSWMVSLLQSENALSPIAVTLFGMVTLVR